MCSNTGPTMHLSHVLLVHVRNISNTRFPWLGVTHAATVSSMHFTNSIPGSDPSDRGTVAPTLQVFSIKISEIKGGLRWPLSVYGVVAAREAVDHNRNLLFARDRSVYQTIKEDVCVLCIFFWISMLILASRPLFPLVDYSS